ncbi:amidohydrolase family protein [Variovorax saccharolyticus]|uniref:amidohydrolase family protein n=1 Tax=Variovorax saccharolyticus TaxID=3053516 RepID=UPI0025750D3D|nr:amidohydrolase family protein [Variovorax sp. J22R187]MDM0022242.1 amidohydrolase family protein [Variovorax sp. J22R187]
MTEAIETAIRNESNPAGAIDPALPIVDCHHHLWHPHAERYMTDAFQADILASGHQVEATVYVECSVMLRREGPAAFRSVGEAEFAAGMAAMSDSGIFGPTRVAAAFIGAVDLTLGGEVDEVLDALHAASGGRLRGVRGAANWDADEGVNSGTRPMAPRGLLLDDRFRAGVARLAQRDLVYDAWQYHPQLPELCALADALPNVTMVLNHCAGLLGVGPYAGPDKFDRWRSLVRESAKRPNVLMKVGGLAGRRNGFGYDGRSSCATLEELAADWRPYIETCIESFGADRCMFESNYPVDKVAGDYQMLWNVFKTVTAGCSPSEKTAMFSGTARRTYAID